MKVKIYTAGYMIQGDRFDWRDSLMKRTVFLKNITWLHPKAVDGSIPGEGDPEIYSSRDVLQIQMCDILLAYIDLSVAKCLGAVFEIGLAYAWQKRIILVDVNPQIHSLDFCRHMSDSVWDNLSDAVFALDFITENIGDPNNEPTTM